MWDVPLISPWQRAHLLAALKDRHAPPSLGSLTPLPTCELVKLGADTSHPLHSTNSCEGKNAPLGGPTLHFCSSLPSQENKINENAWKPQSGEAQPLSSNLLAFVVQASLP